MQERPTSYYYCNQHVKILANYISFQNQKVNYLFNEYFFEKNAFFSVKSVAVVALGPEPDDVLA